jgi:hypothetical protein
MRPGESCRFWKPKHAEHGCRGEIRAVEGNWVSVRWELKPWLRVNGTLPAEHVRAEAEYQAERRVQPNGHLWPE